MAPTSMGPLLRHLRKMTNEADVPNVSDAELLKRFVRSRDEVAFELLVWRHQRMVMGVCRRVLGNAHDAEDAFQAAFLALVRKAASVTRRESVASWLHTVAYRVALRARAVASKRVGTDIGLADVKVLPNFAEDVMRRELASVLDEEVSRLPRKYRVVVVLCYLEGKTYQEAGRILGVPIGTLSARLTRARTLLRTRLMRRGIDISAALFGTLLCEQAASAAVSATLVNLTIQSATSMAAGQSASALSPAVSALTEGALRSMVLNKLKIVAVGMLAGFIFTGMGLLIPAALISPVVLSELPSPATPPAEGKTKAARVDRFGDPLPDGAIRRLGTLRFRHGGGGLSNLLLTPDGKTLVSNDDRGSRTVCVWELATGKLLHRLPGTYNQTNIALSADGKLVAICQKETVDLWELASGKQVCRLAQPGMTGVAFSPDGKTLAAAGDIPDIHLWNLTTGKKIAQSAWKRDPTSIALLAYTPDGKTLIAGQCYDSKIDLWDVASGMKRQELDANGGPIWSLALSPDGTTLATGCRKGGIPLWDVKTGKRVRTLRDKDGEWCLAVSFSPDGKSLIACERDAKNQDLVRLWDVAAGTELRRYKGDMDGNMVFSPDGKTLIAESAISAIRLWDVATGKEVGPAPGNLSAVRAVTASLDGRVFAFMGRGIHFWDIANGRLTDPLPSSPEYAISIAFSPDGKTLAAGTFENATCLWDVNSRKLIRRLKGEAKNNDRAEGMFFAIAFSADGKTLATGGKDGVVRLWDTVEGKELRQLNLTDPDPRKNRWASADAVAFSSDGRLLAASGRTWDEGSTVRIWEAATGKELPHLTLVVNAPDKGDKPRSLDYFERKIISPKVVFSPDGRMLAKNGRQKTISVWESATGRQRLLLEGHTESTVCVAFAPDSRTLASAGWDETIRLWDLDTGRQLRTLTGHRGKANSLAFTADGKMLVSAGDDTTILFWDVADVTRRKHSRVGPLTPAEWESLWSDLARPDAVKAYAAMIRMTGDSSTTLAALKERLHPIRAVDDEMLAHLLKDMNDDRFAVREKAAGELEKLADQTRSALEQALARPGASLDFRRRLEAILASLTEISGERLRALRAIEVLERLGTPEAREVLKTLAAGAPAALPTTAARVALKRLSE